MGKFPKKSGPGPPKKHTNDDSERDNNFFKDDSNDEQGELNERENETENENGDFNERVNEKSRRYACSVCHSVFDGKNKVEEHLTNVDANHRNRGYAIGLTDRSEKREYGCKLCKGKTFDTKEKLESHFRDVHLHYAVTDDTSDLKKCLKCDMRFVTKHSMEEHMTLCHPDVITIADLGKLEILPNRSMKRNDMNLTDDA